jgi:hypothetical protein
MMHTLLLVSSFLATATSQLADKPNFSGPGIVTCLAKDYLAAPCRALDLNALECLHVSSVCREAVLDLEDFLNTITAQIVAGDQVEIELPCKCMQLLDCPVSCTFANTSRSNELMTTSSPQEEASSIPATLELGPESGCTLPIPGNIRLLIALLLVIVAW